VSATVETVYGEDRARRLRMVVWVVVVLAGLLALVSFLGLFQDDTRVYAMVWTVLSLVLVGVGAFALRELPERGVNAKRACLATGFAAVVIGIVLISSVFALPLPLIGFALIFLTLIRDEPAE
jgi:peptidoglycan/LPS O-acetylase OafA/YrhL